MIDGVGGAPVCWKTGSSKVTANVTEFTEVGPVVSGIHAEGEFAIDDVVQEGKSEDEDVVVGNFRWLRSPSRRWADCLLP